MSRFGKNRIVEILQKYYKYVTEILKFDDIAKNT